MSSTLSELQTFDERKAFAITQQVNKLYDAAYRFCKHQCKLREDGEIIYNDCAKYCHETYEIPRKLAMHLGQEKSEYLYKKCLSEAGDELDLTTIVNCTHNTHKDKMLASADHIGQV